MKEYVFYYVGIKKGITITNIFQKSLDKSNCELSKICLDKGSEF